jgi:hypothetical protein
MRLFKDEHMDLKKIYGHKYEIAMDPSWDAETPENRAEFLAKGEQWWYYELRGQRGMVYPFNASTLAVYVTPRTARRLERLLGPALTVHVRCDEAVVYKADIQHAAAIVRFIKPKRLRPLTTEQKAVLAARLARYHGIRGRHAAGRDSAGNRNTISLSCLACLPPLDL